MSELIWYDITCHTDGCKHQDVTIHGQGPIETIFACGPCGNLIDDWQISENQTDGD
jgi:hypothetical protein